MSLAQNFLKSKDPWSKRFSAPGACSWHPKQMATPKDFKLVRYACDLRVWDRWRHPCAPQSREKMMRSKHLHVHCTCTMHPSPLLHTAPSWPCPGAPMYRVWCRWLKVHFHRRTPRQNSFFAPGACSWYPTGTAPPMDFKLVQYACDLRVWVQELSPFDLQERAEIFGRPSRGGTCHVPCAAGRPATGNMVVPAFRRVDRCHPGPDRTSRSGAIPGNA